ncbi:MAG: hypothetical protein IPL84_03560 [Chitinophagaceae bacterium]|nr:hypothetical protein [Chitinophagaceae bacterium]
MTHQVLSIPQWAGVLFNHVRNGYENVSIGVGSLEYSDSSNYNTAVGRGATFTKGGLLNTALGFYSSGCGVGAPTSNYYVKPYYNCWCICRL